MYKNPKKSTTVKGASAMQPAASANDGSGVKLMKGDVVGNSGVPVNEGKFWKRKAEDVPVDEVYSALALNNCETNVEPLAFFP